MTARRVTLKPDEPLDEVRGKLAEASPWDDCLHPGRHCSPIRCIDCGRFSAHSWATGAYYTPNGFNEDWGGVCKVHGEWSESAA